MSLSDLKNRLTGIAGELDKVAQGAASTTKRIEELSRLNPDEVLRGFDRTRQFLDELTHDTELRIQELIMVLENGTNVYNEQILAELKEQDPAAFNARKVRSKSSGLWEESIYKK